MRPMSEVATGPEAGPEGVSGLPPATVRRALRWGAAAAIAVVSFALGLVARGRLGPAPPASPPVARLSILLPSSAPLATGTHGVSLAVSPRGDRLVYVARLRSGTQLFLRNLDQLEAVALAGTEGAADPFVSPDGDWVGFFADGKLKKAPLRGGAPVILCEAPGEGGGGSWGSDGTILFSPSAAAGLARISADGGAPRPVSAPGLRRQGTAILWPEILPGGRSAIITVMQQGEAESARIALLGLDTGEWKVLVEGSGYARYAPTGHLIFVRGGALLAAPFSLPRLTVTGAPIQVLDRILADRSSGAAQVALSVGGTLVFAPAETALAERALVWVDRKGEIAPLLADRAFDLPRLSPDGRRLAMSISDGRQLGLWVHDLAGGTLRRLASDGSDGLPLWSPDGRSLAYLSPRAGAWNIFRREADGRGVPELLASSEHRLSPSSWSPDGRLLAYTEVDPETKGDIWILPVQGDRRPRPFLRTPSDEWGAVFSPDGRLVVYTSNASGRNEVYVRPYPGPGDERRISEEGGYGPLWEKRGDEIVYRSGDRMLAVRVATRPAFSAGRPSVLFEGRYEGPSAGSADYDMTPDGRRFVMVKGREQGAEATQLNVVLGWIEEVKRRVVAAQEE